MHLNWISLFIFPFFNVSVMQLMTIQSDIQEPSPDIVFPNTSDPRLRKWVKETNVISLSPAALDEVAQGSNVEAHVCGVLFKTVGNLSIPVEEGQGFVWIRIFIVHDFVKSTCQQAIERL